MRVIRALVLCSLFLAPILAQGQQDQIPRELALALIPYGGTDGGEIIVGQLPPDLATTFILPPGGRVLGSFVSLSYIQMVMVLPGTPDSARAFAIRSLSAHGWSPRDRLTARMGGLQYGSRDVAPTTFCRTEPSGTGDAISVSTQFHGTGVTLLRLTRTMGSSLCSSAAPNVVMRSSSGSIVSSSSMVDMTQRMGEMPFATLPPLWSPGAAMGSSQRCQESTRMSGSQSQSQMLFTEMPMAEILAHYGRQLDSAGWKVATDAQTASRTWSKVIPNRGTQDVTIKVSALPGRTGCYDVSLWATSLPR